MATVNPNLGLIWNDAKIAIKLPDDSDYTQIMGAVDLTPPDQSFNSVELPYLDESDAITDRIKGSRNGGQMTFNINAKATTDAGLGKVLEAYEDRSNDECSFKITFPNNATAEIERAIVMNCSLQNGSKDTVISYAVSVECNSVVKFTNAS